MTIYEIRAGSHAPCELWCVNSNRMMCEGTHTYCMEIKERLDNE